MTSLDLPTVSIVIPTYRRPERLARCLDALLELDYPRDRLEVVVMEDGGPTDQLAELRARDFGDLVVRILGQPHSGPAGARNRGAREATGELLAFTDDDCCPRADWVSKLVAAHGGASRVAVGGHSENALVGNAYSEASQALVTYITQYGDRIDEQFFASNNFLVSRSVFMDLGGFDESFPLAGGEDRELCDRMNDLDYELRYEPSAVIDHYHALTRQSFWDQHFRYGRGAYQYHVTRSVREGNSLSKEYGGMVRMMARFYAGMVRSPFVNGDRRPLRTAWLLLWSQVPNTLGFFAERRSAGDRD